MSCEYLWTNFGAVIEDTAGRTLYEILVWIYRNQWKKILKKNPYGILELILIENLGGFPDEILKETHRIFKKGISEEVLENIQQKFQEKSQQELFNLSLTATLIFRENIGE